MSYTSTRPSHCVGRRTRSSPENDTVTPGNCRSHHVAQLTSQPTPRASNGPHDGPLVAEIIHGAT